MADRILEITEQEARDLHYLLDDADLLTRQGRDRERRLLELWRRMHLWFMGRGTEAQLLSPAELAHLPVPPEVRRG